MMRHWKWNTLHKLGQYYGCRSMLWLLVLPCHQQQWYRIQRKCCSCLLRGQISTILLHWYQIEIHIYILTQFGRSLIDVNLSLPIGYSIGKGGHVTKPRAFAKVKKFSSIRPWSPSCSLELPSLTPRIIVTCTATVLQRFAQSQSKVDGRLF